MFSSYLTALCQAIDMLVAAAGKLAALLIPVLAAIVAFEVFSRYFLNQPTIWAFDLSLFLFGYISALGGANAQQKRAHINVDIFYTRVNPNTKKLFNLISGALAIFFLLVVMKMSLGKYLEALQYDYRRQSEWAPPMFHFWLMMIIAAGLFVLQLLADLLRDLYTLITGMSLPTSKPLEAS